MCWRRELGRFLASETYLDKQYALLLTLCTALLAMFAYLGTYSRPQSDDLCHIGETAEMSVWEAVLLERHGYNGSSANIIVMNLLGPLGIQVVQLFPAMLIGAWCVTSAALIAKLLDMLGLTRRRWPIALMAAALLVSAACASFYTRQSWFWYTASVKYGLPLALATLYLLLLLHLKTLPKVARPRLWAIAAGGLCFATANFAETFSMVMLLGLTLMLGAVWRAGGEWRERCLPALLAGWVSTVISMLVMLSAPGLHARTARDSSRPEVAASISSWNDWLWQALSDWADRLTDPDVLASFALMVAVGCLVGLALPRRAPSIDNRGGGGGGVNANCLRFGLLVQLLLLPLVIDHQSDHALILGRYSGAYFAVIVCNVALLIGLWILLRKRRHIEVLLGTHAHILPSGLLAIALCMFALTELQSIHWRAYAYLWLSMHSLLFMAAWLFSTRSPEGGAKRFAVGMGILYITILAGMLAVIFSVNAFAEHSILRTFTFFAYIISWSGFCWGVFIGWSWHAERVVAAKATAFIVALWLCVGVVADNLPLASSFRIVSEDFDYRHAQILANKQPGQRHVKIAPVRTNLWKALRESRCFYEYYDIDSLEYADL